MDRIDNLFAMLSERMNRMPVPQRAAPAPESLSSLIDRVNMAKRGYEAGCRR